LHNGKHCNGRHEASLYQQPTGLVTE